MNAPYIWDVALRAFRREQISAFPYTDGVEVEERILSFIRSVEDRSTFSEELIPGIADWPSEYHLSRARHVIVRPLCIKPGDTVLELGCGCGAITRYLGEIGAKVTSVEGSVMRARIAAERCKDLDNVCIVVDDLQRFESEEQFDWILLIGVLEYAPAFSSSADAAGAYLSTVAERLKPEGSLVVAIENRFGLKYFNNCAEDHLGVPFVGVQGLYGTRTARTYGRRELEDKLGAAGLPKVSFLYPFPDYKLPSVVLSDRALDHPEFNAGDVIARATARDYTGQMVRLFDESLTWQGLARNRMLADLSNSFLVVARRSEAAAASFDSLALLYSVHRRIPFATHTRFFDCDGHVRLSRERLHHGAMSCDVPIDGIVVTHTTQVQDYFPGTNFAQRFVRARAGIFSMEKVVAALSPWFALLLEHATSDWTTDKKGRRRLEAGKIGGNLLDLTPFNLIECNSKLGIIDQEWSSRASISLGWVATRGIAYTLGLGLADTGVLPTTGEVLSALCAEFDLSVDPASIELWVDQEVAFQRATMSVAQARGSLIRPTPYQSGVAALLRADKQIDELLGNSHARERMLSDALALREAAYLDRVAELEVSRQQVEELAGFLTKIQNEFAPLRAERDLLARTFGDAESQRQRLSAEVLILKTQVDESTSALAQRDSAYIDRVKEIEGFAAQNAHLRTEIEELGVQLAHTVTERDARIDELTAALEQREAAYKDRLQEINESAAQLTRISTERDALAIAAAQNQAERDKLVETLCQAQTQLTESMQAASALRQATTALEENLGNSHRALHALQSEIGKLLASRSWRLTRPLRVLGRLSRGEWPLIRSVISNRLRSIARKAPAIPLTDEVSDQPAPSAALQVAQEAKNAPVPIIETRHRILLVSYYCPTRAHAGGLRILDIYSLIRERYPRAQLDLYTHHRPSIDWSLDDVHRIFDHIYLSPTEDLSLSGLAALCGTQSTYDVVDLQFHQSAYHLDAFRSIAKKILFTPMESLTKVLFIDLRNRSNTQGKSGMFRMATSLRLASEELTFSLKADEVVCVSRADAAFLRTVTASRRIKGLDTGVSQFEFAEALRPDYVCRPATEKECRLLYVAYFGSETNVVALRWYLDNVHPIVKARVPSYVLSVVGRGDLSSFKKYRSDSIEFVGEVPSIAPYIENSRAGIAPALGGSGFRGKVNQYAVLGIPSVVSSIAFKGLAYQDGVNIFIADSPELFAERCIQLLTDLELNRRMSEAARAVCMERYSWQSKWKAICDIYDLEEAR